MLGFHGTGNRGEGNTQDAQGGGDLISIGCGVESIDEAAVPTGGPAAHGVGMGAPKSSHQGVYLWEAFKESFLEKDKRLTQRTA